MFLSGLWFFKDIYSISNVSWQCFCHCREMIRNLKRVWRIGQRITMVKISAFVDSKESEYSNSYLSDAHVPDRNVGCIVEVDISAIKMLCVWGDLTSALHSPTYTHSSIWSLIFLETKKFHSKLFAVKKAKFCSLTMCAHTAVFHFMKELLVISWSWIVKSCVGSGVLG